MIKKVESIPEDRRGFYSDKSRSVYEDVRTFVDEGHQFAEITDPGYKNTATFYETVHYIIKKFGFDVKVTRRNGMVFLIRGDGE